MTGERNVRVETDTFGPIEVPADHYWGAQTQRCLQNFRIGGERMPPALVRALGIVKLAAARVNQRLGGSSRRLADAIVAGGARRSLDGKLDEHFPLVVWQTGSGTQTNMNANEVIANRANELLGERARRQGRRSTRTTTSTAASRRTTPSRPPCTSPPCEQVDARADPGAASTCTRRCAAKTAGVRRHRQDRPHPPPGRDAAHARPGVLGLRRADRLRHRAREGGAAAGLAARAGRHGGRHRPQRQEGLRRGVRGRGRARSPACRSSPRRTSSRRWRATTRWSSVSGALNVLAAAR